MKKKNDILIKILFIFIILQPIFDILSFLSIRDIIPFNISTYLKPLFVFSFGGYLLLKDKIKIKSWFIYIILFIILVVGHSYLLYLLLVERSVILHELRFMINIAYMIGLFIISSVLFKEYEDKEMLLKKLKNVILITFSLYFCLYFISILTGSSALTYEYADANKLGYKGWYDSGQILGHSFSVLFPMLIYIILSPKKKWYFRILLLILFVSGVSLLGTKVPYYIVIIVLILYIIITLVTKMLNREHQINKFNLFLVIIVLLLMFSTYKYTPVKFNTDINKSNLNIGIEEYDLSKESGNEYYYTKEELKSIYPGKDINRLYEYNIYGKKSSENLIEMFKNKKIHPTNMRVKQINYMHKKFMFSDIEYKIFGLGFLNQNTSLAIESDFFMAIYSFGLLGFLLFLLIPIKEFMKSTLFILCNLKKIDLETYMIYMGLGIFFCISIYAGYTYIYTNFSIFLVLLISMLKIKRNILRKDMLNTKKITFLALHLGYGGIETATVNTANALSNEYDVEIISFYNLEKNQSNRINDLVKVKYLYNGSPNKDKIKECIKNKDIRLFIEGFKAIDILIKKKILIIKEIIFTDAKYIVSTRYDFSILLSKYGFSDTVKIAQEHHYHNNDKKYINILKKKYYRIDYLFALTKTLEKDYKVFLKNNHHTKVVLMPNMLYDIPKNKSKLEDLKVITMSRLDPGKKNDDLIKIFSNIKNKKWHLSILGDGVEYDKLNNLIQELKLENNVTLEGYIPKEKIENYLLHSSIFVMASLTEGLPMVLLEAMSYGIPCIAYETASGVNDIIDDGINGYVIKDRNEKDFINKLEKVINEKDLRNKMGKAAIAKSEKFNKNNILKLWKEILK